MRLLLCFLICLFSIASSIVFAQTETSVRKLTGYKRNLASVFKIYEGEIRRYFDEGENFFILIEGKSAFYRFPKNKESESAVRSFLDEKLKNNSKIKMEVDLKTAQIITLSSPVP